MGTFLDTVPENRIRELFTSGSEDSVPDSSESGETDSREERARARQAARQAARREMREKKAALMQASKKKSQQRRGQKIRETQRAQIAAYKKAHKARQAAAAEEEEEEFDVDLDAVLEWTTDTLGERKVSLFLTQRCGQSADCMPEAQVEVVLHTLLCLYCRKVLKQRQLPTTQATKPYVSQMVSLVDDFSRTGLYNFLLQIEEEEEEESFSLQESESGGAETESDSALDQLHAQRRRKEAAKKKALLAKRAQEKAEAARLAEEREKAEAARLAELQKAEAAKLAEERQKAEVAELTNALCAELHDVVWDLREAQYFFEMTPDCDGAQVQTILAQVEAKICEVDSVNTALVPEVQSIASRAKFQAREEVGYIMARFDRRAAGHVRAVEEGYATVSRVSTWTDKYVNAMAFG